MSAIARHEDPLKQKSREGVLSFWAGELGMSLPELLAPNVGLRVSINHSVPGVLVFRRGNDVRIAASPVKIEAMRERFAGVQIEDMCSVEFWRSRFPDFAGACFGPTLNFYLDHVPKSWGPPPSSRALVMVRGLAASDLKICKDFAAALTRQEREISGLDTLGRQVWGVFVQGTLASISGYDAWPNRVAHIGVATHPDFRGRKFAQVAVQAAVRGAVLRRRIAQYRCLAADAAAAGVGAALGMHCLAETLFIHPPEATGSL